MQRQTADKIERARLRAERAKKQRERRAAYLRAKAFQSKREKRETVQLLAPAYADRLAQAKQMIAQGRTKAQIVEEHGRVIYDHALQTATNRRTR